MWVLWMGQRNPAPVQRLFIPLFIGFQPSKVVHDFFHPRYVYRKPLSSYSKNEMNQAEGSTLTITQVAHFFVSAANFYRDAYT